MPIKVAALVNYSTKYEVVLENGQTSYLVAYTARKSRHGLMSAIRAHGQKILAITNLSESARFTFTSKSIASLGENNWVIRFTGRTQRDAICTRSELPFIESL